MIIIVTGTPCTGKTSLAKALAKQHKLTYVDVSELIKEKNLSEGYDNERKCDIIDTEKLNEELIKIIDKNKDAVIDSHLSHNLPKDKVDLCIVTKCGLKELEKRLKSREYHEEKVRENLDAEIFDICLNEARELKHNTIITVDTTTRSPNELIKEIKINLV